MKYNPPIIVENVIYKNKKKRKEKLAQNNQHSILFNFKFFL